MRVSVALRPTPTTSKLGTSFRIAGVEDGGWSGRLKHNYNRGMDGGTHLRTRGLWKWMLSLTVLAFATFFAPFMFSQIRFESDPYRAAAPSFLGRYPSTLILFWRLVFIA